MKTIFKNKTSISSALLLISFSATAQLTPEKILTGLSSLSSVPLSADYSNADWPQAKKAFPGAVWKLSSRNDFSDVKVTSIKLNGEKVEIIAAGARSMIMYASARIYGAQGAGEIFRNQLGKSNGQSKIICLNPDNMNMETSGESYYEYSAPGMKPVIAKVSWSSGSGGGNEDIEMGSIELPKNCQKKQDTSTQKPAASELKLGYLKGTIGTTSTYGCTYALRSDDKKKRERNQIGGDAEDGAGLVINVNGIDVLVKGKYSDSRIFYGTFNGYTLKIPKSMATFDISNSTGYKASIATVGQCSD